MTVITAGVRCLNGGAHGGLAAECRARGLPTTRNLDTSQVLQLPIQYQVP